MNGQDIAVYGFGDEALFPGRQGDVLVHLTDALDALADALQKRTEDRVD